MYAPHGLHVYNVMLSCNILLTNKATVITLYALKTEKNFFILIALYAMDKPLI